MCTHGLEEIAMATKRISTRFPEDLLEEMDVAAAIEHMDRTELMKQAVKAYLDQLGEDPDFKEKVVDLYLQDRIPFEKLGLLIGTEDAQAVRASKDLIEQGEALARKLA